jgi:branched-chain amino acid transport system ATP-binding protein
MLRVEGLHSYYGTAHVLAGVDLEVSTGEVVGLLGRNGMGKTTLVRSIAGIDPPQVRAGKVLWDDEDLVGEPSYAIAKRGIGLVPQGRHIFGSLTVVENLTVIARGNGQEGTWDIDEVFAFFPRLKDRRGSRGKNLSGGEQQMLAIGRALMTNPRLLLMDEPSEGLAPVVLKTIRERLETLKETDLQILLVEQNLGLALRLCDRIYVLGEGGVIAWSGTPAELEANEQVKRHHLSV